MFDDELGREASKQEAAAWVEAVMVAMENALEKLKSRQDSSAELEVVRSLLENMRKIGNELNGRFGE